MYEDHDTIKKIDYGTSDMVGADIIYYNLYSLSLERWLPQNIDKMSRHLKGIFISN